MNTYSFTRNRAVTPANAGVYGSLLAQGVQVLFLCAALLALAACAGPRGSLAFSKSYKKPSSSPVVAAFRNLAPVVQYGAGDGYGSSGGYTLLPGDTFQKIAAQYGVDLGDLIAMNGNVSLTPGARIKLPAPRAYRVRAGDSVMILSRMFGLSPQEILSRNHLSATTPLRVGQVLSLPSATGPTRTSTAPAYVQMVSYHPAPVQRMDLRSDIPVAAPRMGLMTPPPQKPMAQAASFTPAPTIARPLPQAQGEAPAVQRQLSPLQLSSYVPARAGNRFMRPVNGQVLSRYGAKSGGLYNEGVNIAAPRGSAVRAADNGRVVYVGSGAKGYGNLVLIKHADGYITAYAHMDKVLVTDGQIISRGESIGTVGSTGNVDRAQLHFEIRKGRTSIDPVAML